ncbi:G8 domain-containing protein [Deinococcus koreensis]|uniref:Transmembrane domain-containing protein n=1 Tax=Deinococcus koreensis TaxID=2054903 RepID=A0A2K3UZ46_9DEIO|nr:G8 domain-containing protein [Deinococcus koreensis]PNY81817.1 transmembrane domain-containing protein [Deinococcus koreensis]
MTVPRLLPAALLCTLLLSCGGTNAEPTTSPAPKGTPTPGSAPSPAPSPTANLPQTKWSDPATWGDTVPTAGQKVTLPSGRRVILDVSPPALAGLTIPAGTALEFADQDLTLTSEWVMVHGELRIGSEGRPFTHQAEIVMTNTTPGEDVMGMGDRVLGVMDGTLELHGAPKLAWTRLESTAPAGSRTLTLQRAPDWAPGSSLTLASTDFNPNQTEEVVVQRVSGSTVTLATGLKYTHWAQSTTQAGLTLHERAEVGLLTRTIRIGAGEDASASGLGAHVMVMGKSAARIESTEFTRVGQRNTLRRYGMHFHQMGDAATSYFRGNSVHEVFNRCVVVHGTSNLRVQDNVTHDSVGHCLFLEDGNETGNTISGNLITLVRRPDKARGETPLLDSDKNPSGYWITNPANTVKDNVAAGIQGTGFWYALPEHPTGLAAATGAGIWNRRTPLGEFSGNVAHSGDRGLNVDHGAQADGSHTETTYYMPRVNPADEKSAPAPAAFTRFTAYKQRDQGVWLRGEHHTLSGAVLADNAVGATFASDTTVMKDSLLIGETANVGQPESWEKTGVGGRSLPRPWEADFPIRGFQFYDGHVSIQTTALSAFQPNAVRQASGLGYLYRNAFALNPGNDARGLTWLDDSRRVYLPDAQADKDGDKAATFLDADGSVTGTPGLSVTGSALLRDAPDCSARAEWNASVCGGQYARFWLDDVTDGRIGPVRATNVRGASVELTGTPDNFTSFHTSVRLGGSYAFAPAAASRHLRLGFGDRAPGDTLRLTLPASAVGTGSEPILYRDWWVDERNRLKKVALADLDASSGDAYALEGGTLHLKLVVQKDREYAVVDVCAAALCR